MISLGVKAEVETDTKVDKVEEKAEATAKSVCSLAAAALVSVGHRCCASASRSSPVCFAAPISDL